MRVRKIMVLLVALATAVTACSGDDEPATTAAPQATTAAPQETTVAPEVTEAPSGAVASLEDVRGAIVRIVAEGSFADPEYGQQFNAAGSGSGFFIDSDGIAVTNNHVVTGAAFLQVYVEGEDEPRNARVLGVSECSDLAVIDVEGDGFPFLDWYEGDINVGTAIFAAGFPLGDEEFTLLDGIISKEDADGESDWASVDSVIEHSADTLPGSSGGPIVTADGRVVAVNYAGDSLGQAFGIGRDEALKVIPRLTNGKNVNSVGINGQAIFDGAFSGIWVASVESGSAADLGGVKAGDLVTLIEGLIPATDGTMADYCDILRSHQPGDPLSIEVYRASDDVFLEGTLNTEKILEVSYSFASELGDEVVGDSSAGYASYVSLVDSQGIITVDVPAAWGDVDIETPWGDTDSTWGVAIWSAVDYDLWNTQWDTPGMFFGASAVLPAFETVDSLLDSQDYSSECLYDSRIDYSDALYTGAYNLWVNCGGGDTLFVDLVAETPGSEVLMNVQVTVVTDADLEALDTVLSTFVVDDAALAEFSGVAVTSGGDIAFGELWPGDCFNVYGTPVADIVLSTSVEVVGCEVPHHAEVYGNYFIPDAAGTAYPGPDALVDIAADYCFGEFAPYVGATYDESILDYWWHVPDADEWSSGVDFVMCSLVDFVGDDLVGSAFESGW